MSEDVATTSAHKETAPASKSNQESKRKASQLTDEPGADSLPPQKWFSVVDFLHLGLGLKLGAVYSEQDLRGRCRGQKTKLTKLEQFFSNPTFLKEIPSRSATAAKARRGELATVETRDQTARKRHIGPAAVWPAPRATEPGLLGEGSVAWEYGDNRSPWPVQLQSLISAEGEPEVWRVKPLGTVNMDELEVPASQLRPFAFGDLRALAALTAETELTDNMRAARESADNGACQV